ncbi:NAD-dependent epimerase/dehydratase family protein [Arenibaculum sp.]|jgi:nucleoside-diphosphate-sugar epimerase|uniref:NAD-dependent epimerase/dehydratase family protein n=1 Tax=Arenibaculum sp. TaxID=2865862 RepID=UPI002E116C44|nr:NAD-dependent epimerase/dehydratase family protein [Arenibaculum sp.]
MTRVLVTGATGFVGRRLVERLLADGIAVRATVRRPNGIPVADAVQVGEIGADTDWTTALQGIDVVVHLAARVHILHDEAADALAAFRRTNVEGTRQLAVSAARAGIGRVILVSSVKALADQSGKRPLTDDDIPRPGTPYGVSKLEAERALEDACRGTGTEWTALRPPLVYGPGVGANFGQLLALCQRRLPLPLGSIGNRRSLIAVDNLVDAVLRCIDHPAAAGRSFLVHDGPSPSTPDLVRTLSSALSHRARLFPVPPLLLRAALHAAGRPDAFDRIAGSLHVDDSPFRRACGWLPPLPQDAALRATALWFAGREAETAGGGSR